jgi:hypothetical protein
MNRTIDMKKRVVLILMLVLATAGVWAQEGEENDDKKGFQKEKLFVGGNFGLAFGNYTFINISPQLGYRFTKLFAAGMGVNGQYVSFKERYYDTGDPYRKVSQTVIGLNVFGRVYPIRNIMLQAQPEANYIFGKQIFYGPPKQEFKLDASIVPSLLMGGGLVLPSGRSEMLITVFYDVLQAQGSPYGRRPIFNFGYNIGL